MLSVEMVSAHHNRHEQLVKEAQTHCALKEAGMVPTIEAELRDIVQDIQTGVYVLTVASLPLSDKLQKSTMNGGCGGAIGEWITAHSDTPIEGAFVGAIAGLISYLLYKSAQVGFIKSINLSHEPLFTRADIVPAGGAVVLGTALGVWAGPYVASFTPPDLCP